MRGLLLVGLKLVHASAAAAAPRFAAPPSFRCLASPDGHVLISERASDWTETVGVRPLLSESTRRRLLRDVTAPDFEWTTDRHKLFPTTDVEVHSLPWLDKEMAMLLKDEIFPSIAWLYRTEASNLFLRDQFVVKYSSATGGQAALGSHYDESCFSFVVQLNDPGEFVGGGTLFAHATEAVSVPEGHCLFFCGYNYHEGVAVTKGCRYILTGFVDYREADERVQPFYGAGELPRPYGAGSHDFPSPHLPTNRARLSEAYGHAVGSELLRRIAYNPPALRHVDTEKLAKRCANFLQSGFVPDVKFYMFLQAIVGDEPVVDEPSEEPAEQAWAEERAEESAAPVVGGCAGAGNALEGTLLPASVASSKT